MTIRLSEVPSAAPSTPKEQLVMTSEVRSQLTRAKRIVVKIGSRALANDPAAAARLAEEVAVLRTGQRCFVIVTSGAIAIGCSKLGYRGRPKEIAKLQAAASAGQSVLMRRYERALGQHEIVAAQVLLTHSDLSDRERLNNARQALAALLEAGAVPIINENDAVATDEIRFGDNDQLAAMVAPMVGADLLILLTDVEGVLDSRGRRIRLMTDKVQVAELEEKAGPGTGGMKSKLDAARKGCRAGAHVVIASASQPNVVTSVLRGDDIGTLFLSGPRALRARKHWIAYTLKPRGALVLDEGAGRAVRAGRCSLLPVGIIGVRGGFGPGDAVQLVGLDGMEIGRGLTRLGALDVARAAGKKGHALEVLFGRGAADVVVVHKDDLVVDGTEEGT